MRKNPDKIRRAYTGIYLAPFAFPLPFPPLSVAVPTSKLQHRFTQIQAYSLRQSIFATIRGRELVPSFQIPIEEFIPPYQDLTICRRADNSAQPVGWY